MSCSDGNCFFRDRSKPFGQVTNGGCHCLDDVNSETRIELRRFKEAILSENTTLKKPLEVAVSGLINIKELSYGVVVLEGSKAIAGKALAEIKRIGGGE